MGALPESAYLKKLGIVVYLVSSIEGLLLFDLPRLRHGVPPQLDPSALAGKTTAKIGEMLVKHSPNCTDDKVAAYLDAGGRALLEIAPLRNAMLHARPATDPEGQQRLYRWHVLKRPQEAHFIDDAYLDHLIKRINALDREVSRLRPRLI